MLPRPFSWYKEALFLRGRGGKRRKKEGRERKRREGRGE